MKRHFFLCTQYKLCSTFFVLVILIHLLIDYVTIPFAFLALILYFYQIVS